VYSTTYVSTLSGNANMALSLIQGTGVDLGIWSNPNSDAMLNFSKIILYAKSDIVLSFKNAKVKQNNVVRVESNMFLTRFLFNNCDLSGGYGANTWYKRNVHSVVRNTCKNTCYQW
jgi:hypothetical protein